MVREMVRDAAEVERVMAATHTSRPDDDEIGVQVVGRGEDHRTRVASEHHAAVRDARVAHIAAVVVVEALSRLFAEVVVLLGRDLRVLGSPRGRHEQLRRRRSGQVHGPAQSGLAVG